MRYNYWLLRYVPDTLRGEMVNVGVLVGRDFGDWAIRRVHSFQRASRLGGNASKIVPWLEELERRVENEGRPPLEMFIDREETPLSEAAIRRLRVRLNNAIQISAPVAIEGTSASESASFLFDFLVNEASVAPRSSTRRRLVSALREQYLSIAALDVGTTLQTNTMARVGRQRARFDFAVIDDSVAQLSQVWSFDISDADKLEQDIHAWSYGVTRLRNDGGTLGAGSGNRLWEPKIKADVPIVAVYQAPKQISSGLRQNDVLEAAREAWANLNVELVSSADLTQVARDAATLT